MVPFNLTRATLPLLTLSCLGCIAARAGHPPAPQPEPQPTPARADRSADGITPHVADLEEQTYRAINDHRRAAGLGTLTRSAALDDVARDHSRDQARSGGGSRHEGSDGRGPSQRFRDAGIAYSAMAENVAMNYGYDDPVDEAVKGWMASAGHRRNILEPRYRKTGVGVALAGNGAVYFTQVFLDPPATSAAPRAD